MRRYAIAPADLIGRIRAHRPSRPGKPGWIERAEVRTREYVGASAYTGGSEFWGEIKDAYIRLHNEKCAYCETRLQGAALASKVHEVEHFRPKSGVKAWPPARRPSHLKDFVAPCALGSENARGYYGLAYHRLRLWETART